MSKFTEFSNDEILVLQVLLRSAYKNPDDYLSEDNSLNWWYMYYEVEEEINNRNLKRINE